MTFEEFRLAEPILRAVRAEGYTIPTPIQVKAIPHVLNNRDVLGCAQTGTGKTAAFALPILHNLAKSRTTARRGVAPIRVLILAPTRELAAQIGDSFRIYGQNLPLNHAVIFGGVGQNPQVRALKSGVDILVATPGRLLDLMEQGYVNLQQVEILVLDEADRMLDMGFIRDIRKVVAEIPKKRQTLLFSATMPADIRELANAILQKPVHVQVAATSQAAETIEQSVYFVERRSKPAMLKHFLSSGAVTRALVFTRTKRGADVVVRHLSRAGIRAEAIHGNKSQNARTRTMSMFKSNSLAVLVATDIAARGLDIDEISHVINYDVPNIPETYVHRIGRTGRAGASGLAVSFCDSQEVPFLRDIERLICRAIPVSADRPVLPEPEPYPAEPAARAPRRNPRSQPDVSRGRRRQDSSAPRTESPRKSSSVAVAEPARRTAASEQAVAGKSGTVVYRSRGKRRSGQRAMWRN